MGNRSFASRAVNFGLLGAIWLLSACSSSGNTERTAGNTTGGTSSTLAPGQGYCMDTCTKDCTTDQDCNMSQGEMCCDLSTAGKTCLQASECPVACSDDTKCNTSSGQACERITIATTQKYCASPTTALQTCQADGDCSTGDVCCANYKQPICLPPTECPKACTASTDCQTSSGEICCTSVTKIEPNLNVTGLCTNPTYSLTSGYANCPKLCTTSTDCDTANNEICCNGLCTTDHSLCPQTCTQSSDCNAQICCKSALMRVPDLTTHIFTTGPTCTGTPYYTCSSSSCSSVLGCTATSGGGTCNSYGYTCSEFNSSSTSCASITGCTYSSNGSSGCSVFESYLCSDFDDDSYDCTGLGCTYSSSTYLCTGTPTTCSTFTTSTACDDSFNCIWSGTSTGTCSGTPAACSTNTNSTACAANYNCYWSSTGTTTCTGTATPCSQLTPTQCSSQYGCSLSTVTL